MINLYKEVCKTCGSEEVARCKWVNVNTAQVYSADSGTTLEWCFGECQGETTIVEQEETELKQLSEDFSDEVDKLRKEDEA